MDKLTAVLFLLVLIRFVFWDLYFLDYHKGLTKLLKMMARKVDENSSKIDKMWGGNNNGEEEEQKEK